MSTGDIAQLHVQQLFVDQLVHNYSPCETASFKLTQSCKMTCIILMHEFLQSG